MSPTLVFVDCEAFGGAPATGKLTEFGAVRCMGTGMSGVHGAHHHDSFYGLILPSKPSAANPAVPEPVRSYTLAEEYVLLKAVFMQFEEWLAKVKGRPIFVSDNVAFDWQWINDGFWRTLGHNPFGHSGRRISDYYAGLTGNFANTQAWKRLRVTKHDHNPVNDAMGNLEAFERIQRGER